MVNSHLGYIRVRLKKIGKDNAGMTKNNSLKARVANKNLTDRELEVLGM